MADKIYSTTASRFLKVVGMATMQALPELHLKVFHPFTLFSHQNGNGKVMTLRTLLLIAPPRKNKTKWGFGRRIQII